MRTSKVIEAVIYGLLIVAMLAAILLTVNAPSDFLSVNPVYKGF